MVKTQLFAQEVMIWRAEGRQYRALDDLRQSMSFCRSDPYVNGVLLRETLYQNTSSAFGFKRATELTKCIWSDDPHLGRFAPEERALCVACRWRAALTVVDESLLRQGQGMQPGEHT
jgi:hypothetical protein